jgi:hypothetical protein
MYTMSEYARRYVTDSGERWRQMEPLWERGSSQLINNYVIKEQYVEAMYVQQAEDGVQYYESRHSLSGGLYVLDPNAIVTFGKRNIDYDGRLDINLTLSVLDKVSNWSIRIHNDSDRSLFRPITVLLLAIIHWIVIVILLIRV